MKKMCRRVVAHSGFAYTGVDHRVHFVAQVNRLFGDDFVSPHSLYRVVTPGDVSDDRIVIVGVEPAAIADLAAGFGVEGRVI